MIMLVFTLPSMTPDFSFLMHGLFSSLVLIYRFKSLSLSSALRQDVKLLESVILYQDVVMALCLSCSFMPSIVFVHQL